MNTSIPPEELERLRAALTRQRQLLAGENEAESDLEGANDTVDSDKSNNLPGDFSDVSADQTEWDTGHQELLDREAQLAEVEHALEKFALGTYGLCEQCGLPIPLARLRVAPAARYDIAHQSALEGHIERPYPRARN